VLQQLEIPVIGPDECREWYKSGGYPAEISDNLICAGIPEGGKDACLVISFYLAPKMIT